MTTSISLLDSPLRSMARIGSLRNDSKKRCASITGLPAATPAPLFSATDVAVAVPSSRTGADDFSPSPSDRRAASASASASLERPKKRRLPPAAEQWPGPSGEEEAGRLMMLHPPEGLRDLEGLTNVCSWCGRGEKNAHGSGGETGLALVPAQRPASTERRSTLPRAIQISNAYRLNGNILGYPDSLLWRGENKQQATSKVQTPWAVSVGRPKSKRESSRTLGAKV